MSLAARGPYLPPECSSSLTKNMKVLCFFSQLPTIHRVGVYASTMKEFVNFFLKKESPSQWGALNSCQLHQKPRQKSENSFFLYPASYNSRSGWQLGKYSSLELDLEARGSHLGSLRPP